MLVLLNLSPMNSGWKAALNKAQEMDRYAIVSKSMLFVVADKLCELIKHECSGPADISVKVQDREFSIWVDGGLVIKFHLIYFEGLLPVSVLLGEEMLDVSDVTIRSQEISDLIDGKGTLLIREIDAILQWVDSVSERMEEDQETVRRVKNGLIMLRMSMMRLKGFKVSD